MRKNSLILFFALTFFALKGYGQETQVLSNPLTICFYEEFTISTQNWGTQPTSGTGIYYQIYFDDKVMTLISQTNNSFRLKAKVAANQLNTYLISVAVIAKYYDGSAGWIWQGIKNYDFTAKFVDCTRGTNGRTVTRNLQNLSVGSTYTMTIPGSGSAYYYGPAHSYPDKYSPDYWWWSTPSLTILSQTETSATVKANYEDPNALIMRSVDVLATAPSNVTIETVKQPISIQSASGGGGGGGGCTCCASAFPNPSTGQLTLSIKDADGKNSEAGTQKISITDSSNGKIVFEGDYNKEFDFSKVVPKSGTYIVNVPITGCTVMQTKVVIDK